MIAAAELQAVGIDSTLRLGHEATDVSPADVAGHDDAALPPLARDCGRAVFDNVNGSQTLQWNAFARGRRHQQGADRGWTGTQRLGQAHNEGKAELSFDDLAERLAAQRFH